MTPATPASGEPRQRWRGLMAGRYLMCQWLQDVRTDGGCRKEAKISVADIMCCNTCARDASRVSLELREAAAGLQEYVGDPIERP